MTIKLGRKYLFILVVCTFLWNQQTSIIAQKIAIENSYQQKVSAAISSLLGEEKFLVIVSIEFSTVGGILKKTPSPQSTSNPSGTYIPGLPTVPSNQGEVKSYNSGFKTLSGSNLEIGRVDVIIGMNETSITPSIIPEIESLIKKIIPQIKDCEDCIKIQAMQFQSNQKNVEIERLREEVEELQSGMRTAKLEADAIHLANLDKQLTAATKKIAASETMENQRNLQRLQEDSIRFAQLVEAERNRQEQDSLRFINTEKRLERVMESKIKSDSVIIRDAMSIVKQQAGGGKDDESLLGMQVGGGSSSIMSYVLIIFLIISLMVVTFLAANNRKPKTIYLKPKGSGKEKNEIGDKKKKESKDEENESDEKSEVDEDSSAEAPTASLSPRPDEDAVRSELKSLRQTAVSLTVGEKEGASALIKEWLEDNPNKVEEGEEAGGE